MTSTFEHIVQSHHKMFLCSVHSQQQTLTYTTQHSYHSSLATWAENS